MREVEKINRVLREVLGVVGRFVVSFFGVSILFFFYEIYRVFRVVFLVAVLKAGLRESEFFRLESGVGFVRRFGSGRRDAG